MTDRSWRMIGQARCFNGAPSTRHFGGCWQAVASWLFICLASTLLEPGAATAQDAEVKAATAAQAQPAAVAPSAAPGGQPVPGGQPIPAPGGQADAAD